MWIDGAVYSGTITKTGSKQITLGDAPTLTIFVDYYDTATVASPSEVTASAGAMATLSRLVRRVRSHLGESYSEMWNDEDLKDWINQACYRIAEENDFWWMQATPETVYAVSGTTTYNLTNNIKKISQVLDITSTNNISEFAYVSYDQFNVDALADDIKSYYSFVGSSLITKVSANTTLKIKYYRYPPKLTDDDDETIVPAELEDAIIYFAVARAREQEEEIDQAAYFDKRFREVMDKSIISNAKRVSKAYPSFGVVTAMF